MHEPKPSEKAVESVPSRADQRARMPAPALQVTLLFTDIEGSTALWERDATRMSQALALHDALARSSVESHGGSVVKTTGDGIHAVFDDASAALAATLDLQRALHDSAVGGGAPLRVRCGLHRGVVEHRDGDYFGSTVNRAARIMSAAHGGQILLSEAVADGVRDCLPAQVSLRDLGRVRLRDLSTPECVYQVVHPQLRAEFPALRSLETTPNNLPLQPTTFIGRDKELTELKRLFAAARLLTLTGSGGCGKTRLGLQLAADSLERFPDGAWLVELAPLSDPGLVPRTAATVLALEEEPGKPITTTLVEHLKDKRALLLLDNCEHLLGACATLAESLVRQCPHLTILASSREALGIAGEQTYRVPSLSLPDPKETPTPASIASFEALQLFVDRCLKVDADFRVTGENAATLVSICHRLDGIPLAIELAAARVRSLSVEELNRRLDHRFRLLTGGSRTALPRQQTLRSLIDWSYDLLHDPEKLLLQRLSVFAGGWTLEAAECVCAGGDVEDGAVLDLLTSLIDKSLVAVDQSDARSRYRLLETVRQYARERLVESGGAEAIRERHRDYFVALAEEADNKLLGAEQADCAPTPRRRARQPALGARVEPRGRRRRRKISASAERCTASGSRGAMSPREGNGVRGSSPKAYLPSPPWSTRGWSMPPAASPGIRPTFAPHGRCSSKALRFREASMIAWASRVLSTTWGPWRSSKATIRRRKRSTRRVSPCGASWGIGAARPACWAIWPWLPGSVAILSPLGHWRKSL